MKTLKNGLSLAKGIWHFFDLVRHPEHLDRVFEISDALAEDNTERLSAMREGLIMDPRAAAALRERPRIRVDLARLDKTPPGTLGRVFADHMRANGLDPAAIPTLPSETELQYIRAHFYETHDVWHAVTGFHTDVAGELGLQAFYAAQTPAGLPEILIGIGMLNAALFSTHDAKRRLDAMHLGYAMGKRARPLFGVRWAELWLKPIDEVRRELGIEPCVESLEAVRAAAA